MIFQCGFDNFTTLSLSDRKCLDFGDIPLASFVPFRLSAAERQLKIGTEPLQLGACSTR